MSVQVPSGCNNAVCRESFKQERECKHEVARRVSFKEEPSSSSYRACQKRFVVHSTIVVFSPLSAPKQHQHVHRDPGATSARNPRWILGTPDRASACKLWRLVGISCYASRYDSCLVGPAATRAQRLPLATPRGANCNDILVFFVVFRSESDAAGPGDGATENNVEIDLTA